jgi:dipeptidyl aminopeptidase/acylaminoacyl peptidase
MALGPKHLAGEFQLTHLNDGLRSQLDLTPLEPFWFTGAEGTKVEGFLLRPPGFDPNKKYPLKFILHGGPQTMAGDSWSYRWNWELMAASGYVVIGINRRGSTGYGQKFVDEVSGDWGGRAYEDLMKGLDYAEANFPFIDKTRECALGASYGGFMADWLLTHTNRFQCIVTHDGLYDAGAAWGSTEEMWFPEWEFRRPEDFPKGWDGFSAGYDPMGAVKTNTGVLRSAQDDGSSGAIPTSRNRDVGHPDSGHAAEPWRYAALPASEDPFRKWSPKEYIQNAKTPTLIIHSQLDYRLDVSQGFELYTALQRQGVPSRFFYFPDEGHWVLKPKDSELWNAVVSDWCDRWTKSGKYADEAGAGR